jgi:hypothetical protein
VNDRRVLARQAGLLVVTFVATLILLGGAVAILNARGGGARATGTVGGTPIATGPGTASPSGPTRSGPGPSSGSAAGSGSPPDARLTGAGDIADCTLEGAARTSDLLTARAGTIFTAGDNAFENGTAAEFAACYQPTWGRVRDRTLPAAGEHDYNTGNAAAYLAYFGQAAAPDGTTWYSTELGAWHVIVLDSDCARVGGCGDASPQGRWLAADLAAHAANRCTLAIWHHPRFSSGEHGDDPEVGPFWNQLIAAGADLVVNGHDQDYERFAPQDASGNVNRKTGIRELVVGTGGAVLRPFRSPAANSEFRMAGAWGVISLTLHPLSYDWEFVPVSTDVSDSGSTPCH